MGEGEDGVLLLLQRRLHVGEGGPTADGRQHLINLDAVGLEAVGESIAKVTTVEDQCFLTRFD